MGLLDDMLAADAESVFCNPQDFGESLVHTARDGTATTFDGLVERDPPVEVRNAGGEMKRPKMIINIPRSAVASLDSGDTVTVAYELGTAAKAYSIGQPLSQDAGMWRVPVL